MSNGLHEVCGPLVETVGVPAHAAATATELVNIWRAPFACKVRTVEIIPDVSITGTATNYTDVNLVNAGTDGAGTTELANKDFLSGTNGVAGTAIALYAPATYLSVASGVLFKLQLEKVGTGLALPRFFAVITYEAA